MSLAEPINETTKIYTNAFLLAHFLIYCLKALPTAHYKIAHQRKEKILKHYLTCCCSAIWRYVCIFIVVEDYFKKKLLTNR